MSKVAIVAALQREVRSLVSGCHTEPVKYEGKSFRLYTSEKAVVVCGGMGAEAARRATQALLSRTKPSILVSAGFARALWSDLRVGDIVIPAEVYHVARKQSYPTLFGEGQLWTSPMVVESPEVPAGFKLGQCKGVDMEAAAVAEVATGVGIPFVAVKAVSDEALFRMPPMNEFIDRDGGFRTGAFLLHVLFRPRTWRSVVALAHNSSQAASKLCGALRSLIEHQTVQGYDLNVELAKVSEGATR